MGWWRHTARKALQQDLDTSRLAAVVLEDGATVERTAKGMVARVVLPT